MDSGMVRTEALAARERMRKVLMDTHLHLDAIEVDDLVVLAVDTLNQAIRRLPGERRAAFAEALRGCLRELEGSLAAKVPPRRAAVQTHANGADLKAAREHKVRQRALRDVMARHHIRSIAYRRSRDGADHPLYGDGPRLTTRSSPSTAAPGATSTCAPKGLP
ncbi:MAG: hypothetical protein QME87_02060 [Bacillota bacterium]|nr:hypothetical protein [Bacillota bacterium]